MGRSETCPACGATRANSQTCAEHFHTLLAWELDHALYDVHHLLVLCFYLQHPENYSPEALTWALRALAEFLETNLTPNKLRQRAQRQFDPAIRTHRINSRHDSHGAYTTPVNWSMHIADVVASGLKNYYASINTWAESIHKDLLVTGNLPTSEKD